MACEPVIFGAAYYPEYIPYDRIEKDISLMKAAGMNTVRIAESTWSTEEPREGVFDFSYVDAVLSALERHGMKAIVGTPTYAVPAWLVRQVPDVMVMRKDGSRVPYGARQSMDILHPAFRFYAERIIRKLVSHVAQHPAVCGYQIDNETKHYGNYGIYAQRLFKDYLIKKFGSTEAFNQAFRLAYWSNSISSWDDLPDVRGSINGGLLCEYESFLRGCVAQYLQWQADIVNEYRKPDQFITHNFDFAWRGYSYSVQPGVNHAEASAAVTLAGTDIYHPSQDMLTGAEIAFGGDSTRCLKQAGYLVLETEAQGFKEWTPYPSQLRLQAYSHLASGAKGMMYWSWQSIHNSFETYWKGLLSHDLAPNPAYEEAARFGREWQDFGAEKLCIRKENRIALVTDNRSLSALDYFPIDRLWIGGEAGDSFGYNDVLRWMYDSLYELNAECDVVDINVLDVSRYRMVIIPALYCVSEANIAKIRRFVEAGGVVVASFKSFFADECATVWDDAQPHGLADCFGVSYSQFVAPGKMMLSSSPCRHFAELLVPSTAEVLARYTPCPWGDYAGLVRNAFGKGHAYYVGSFVSKDVLKGVFRCALADAGIDLLNAVWPLIVRSGKNAEGKVLHYAFNYSAEEARFASPYPQAVDILSGKAFREGDDVALDAWGVRILQEG